LCRVVQGSVGWRFAKRSHFGLSGVGLLCRVVQAVEGVGCAGLCRVVQALAGVGCAELCRVVQGSVGWGGGVGYGLTQMNADEGGLAEGWVDWNDSAGEKIREDATSAP
jgi:hypothetical protein